MDKKVERERDGERMREREREREIDELIRTVETWKQFR